jgi:hypothetical protein
MRLQQYVIADTPEQQIRPLVAFMMKDRGAKSVYLIGDDYVWPRKCNEQAKKYIADNGGKVVAEEYVPFGAPNKFEEIVTRIKSAKPDMVLITLVGADNVNFNRTFAGSASTRTSRGCRSCSKKTRCLASAPMPATTCSPRCPTMPTRRARRTRSSRRRILPSSATRPRSSA